MGYRDAIQRTVDWMEGDVMTCYTARANLACGTLICAYAESLGAHFRGCQKEVGESETNFVVFVRSYLDGFMAAARDSAGAEKKKVVTVDRGVQPVKKKRLAYPEILYKLFRCGFAHEHFPKYGTGIVRDTPEEHFPYLVDSEPAYYLVVNLSHFVPDFLSALRRYSEDVVGGRPVALIEKEGRSVTVDAGAQWDKRGDFLLAK